MLSRILRQWKLFPITSLLVVVSVALYVATRVYLHQGPPANVPAKTPAGEQAKLMDTLVVFGAVGLHEVWDGEWWRLLVSGLHHGFLLHLLGNVIAVGLMGRLLETEFPRWWFLLFCLGSLMLTVTAESLTATPAVGISGTGCAMMGLIFMHRRRDPELAWIVPRSAIWMGLLSLLAGIPLRSSGALAVANIAHFSGLGYGLLVGLIDGWKNRTGARGLFAAMHLALIPLTLLAMKPTWTDSYRFRQVQEQQGDVDRRIELLAELVESRPEQTYYRQMLAETLFLENRNEEAWRVALDGWNGNSTSGQRALTILLQQLWSRLGTVEQRERYEAVMDELFADRADWAKQRLDLGWHSVRGQLVEELRQLRDARMRQAREPEPGQNLPSPDSQTSAALGSAG